VARTSHFTIMAPAQLSGLWPGALAQRIWDTTAHVIHVPFKREPLKDAISQFSHDVLPRGGGLGVYSAAAYRSFGVQI
jgi:hypothetical protein